MGQEAMSGIFLLAFVSQDAMSGIFLVAFVSQDAQFVLRILLKRLSIFFSVFVVSKAPSRFFGLGRWSTRARVYAVSAVYAV